MSPPYISPINTTFEKPYTLDNTLSKTNFNADNNTLGLDIKYRHVSNALPFLANDIALFTSCLCRSLL